MSTDREMRVGWAGATGRLLAAAGGFATLVAATVAGAGLPLLLGLGSLVFAAFVLVWPLVGMFTTMVSQVIWVIGNYAPGGISALAVSKLVSVLTLGAWLLWAMRRRVPMTYAPHMIPLALYGLVVALGPLLYPVFEDSLIGIGKHAMMFLPYFLVANLAVTRRALIVASAALSITATLAAGLAFAELLLPGGQLQFGSVSLGAHTDELSLGSGLAIKRVTGGIGDANWFSYTMATALPLCLFWVRAFRSPWIRGLAIGAAIMQAGGLVVAYTRTPLIGVAGAVLFLLWRRRLPVVPVLLLSIVMAASAPLWLPSAFLERFFSSKYLKEGSTPMRREIFEMAAELIQDRPVLGYGYQQFGANFIDRSTTDMGLEWGRRDESGEEPAYLLRAHNLYLDVAVQFGLVGLAFLVAMYWLLLRELAQTWRYGTGAREEELAVCLAACLIAFFLCGMGGHCQELKIFWLMAGLAAALRRVALGPQSQS